MKLDFHILGNLSFVTLGATLWSLIKLTAYMIHFKSLHQQLKITNSDQFYEFHEEYKLRVWQTRTPGHASGGTIYLRGVSNPCGPVIPAATLLF